MVLYQLWVPRFGASLFLRLTWQDWLPENHLARFVAEVVQQLDLSDIYDCYERKDGRGLAAYHPEMLTRLLLYGYAIGESSSRRIEQATYDNVAFRYLAADQHPDHDTISSFRQQHLQSLGRLFVQALRLCQKAGLVKLGYVAIDGTKLEANASRHKSMSQDKLSTLEQYWKERVDEILRCACEADERESRDGEKPCAALPDDLARAQSRLKRLEEAKRELEQEAQQRLEDAQREWSSRGKRGRPRKGEEPLLHTKECSKERKRYITGLCAMLHLHREHKISPILIHGRCTITGGDVLSRVTTRNWPWMGKGR